MTDSKKTISGKKAGNTDLYDHLIKYTGLFGGIQGLMLLINVVRVKLVSLFIGPAGFGINESFNRTLNLVKSTTDLGIPFSSVQKISECSEQNDASVTADSILVTRTWSFITACVGTLVCLILSPLFSMWAFEGDSKYTWSFVILSVVVGFGTITGGETAILKGTGMLKQIAKMQLLSVIALLLISIPLFWILGISGLVPSLVLVSFAALVITCRFSFGSYPYRIKPFSKEVLTKGTGMIKLGVFYTIAAFFGSGAFSIIANYLMRWGGPEVTGIYSAGYMLISYLGLLVFSAMESDYFPRLSAVNKDRTRINELVNLQAEVALLLLSPLTIGFMVFLELLVNLFLSTKFIEAVPMARIAVISLAFRALTKPMSYVSLAKGDSKTYMLQEVIYDILFVLIVMLFFRYGGIVMTGAALAVLGVLDLLVVGTITHVRYGVGLKREVMKIFLIQLPLMAAAWLSITYLEGWWHWIAGCVLLAVSAIYSLVCLKSKTSIVDSFRSRFNRYFKR